MMTNELPVPAVNDWLDIDGWRIGTALLPSDWHLAPFRVESPGTGLRLAVRVEVTGRGLVLRRGVLWVRVAVSFVGDGEPDLTVGGYLRAL